MTSKPVVLHLGDAIEYNVDIYKQLEESFTVIHPTLEERQRDAWLQALRDRKWGDFQAVYRPYWNTGLEMGRWDAEMIPLLPSSLRVFASAGAGYDWADVDLLAKAGILYCNGAAASSEAVADMAIYHIISVFRNLQWSNEAAKSGDPTRFADAHKHQPLGAHNPSGQTLGIVGLGNIGYRIAEKAWGCFRMHIIYHDLFPKTPDKEAAIGGARRVGSLEELLAEADCTVLATPGSKDGETLINRETLGHMKQGSRLVNIARGSLVDEEALADAMDSGRVWAVGLDVHTDEPNVNQRLRKMRNASLTSHNAGGAFETSSGFEGLSMKNVLAVLGGKEPLTAVNRHMMN